MVWQKKVCSPDWLGVTIWVCHLSTCMFLSYEPTPWVNETGFTPSHLRTTPSQCPSPGNREAAYTILSSEQKRLQAADARLLASPHTASCQEWNAIPVWRVHIAVSQALFSPTGLPSRCCRFAGQQLLPAPPYPEAAWKNSYLNAMQKLLSVSSKITITLCPIISTRDAEESCPVLALEKILLQCWTADCPW